MLSHTRNTTILNSRRSKFAAAAVSTAVAVGGFGAAGAFADTSAAPTPAPATTAAEATMNATAAVGDCGAYVKNNQPEFIVYIRNCHNYTVKRKIIINLSRDSGCITVPANSTREAVRYTFPGSFNRMEAC